MDRRIALHAPEPLGAEWGYGACSTDGLRGVTPGATVLILRQRDSARMIYMSSGGGTEVFRASSVCSRLAKWRLTWGR